jgi:hypothetical protein
LIEVDGFSLFRSDRNTNGGGGVALYIKNTMVVSQIPLHTIPSITQSSSEILAVFIHHANIAIIVIYHPFWGNSLHYDSAVMALEDLCDYIRINYTACSSSPSRLPGIIIAGDINDLRLSLEKLCESLNLTSMVHFPTRGSSCLDQIITDLSSLYHVPQCHPPLGRSDHAVVSCQPKKRPPTKIIYKKRVRKFSLSGKGLFSSFISTTNWQQIVSSCDSVNECFDLFLSILASAYDQCFPWRTVRVRQSDPPWVKDSLRILIDQRDSAYKKRHTLKYLRLREDVIRHVKELKGSFLASGLSNSSFSRK